MTCPANRNPCQFPIQGNGTETRAFYTDDAAEGIVLIMERGAKNEIITTRDDHWRTQLTGSLPPWASPSSWCRRLAGFTPRRCPTSKRAYAPSVSLDEGLLAPPPGTDHAG